MKRQPILDIATALQRVSDSNAYPRERDIMYALRKAVHVSRDTLAERYGMSEATAMSRETDASSELRLALNSSRTNKQLREKLQKSQYFSEWCKKIGLTETQQDLFISSIEPRRKRQYMAHLSHQPPVPDIPFEQLLAANIDYWGIERTRLEKTAGLTVEEYVRADRSWASSDKESRPKLGDMRRKFIEALGDCIGDPGFDEEQLYFRGKEVLKERAKPGRFTSLLYESHDPGRKK